jgi:cysteinyl-tRNA synthetase
MKKIFNEQDIEHFLEMLCWIRYKSKQKKDYVLADKIRELIIEGFGYSIEDNKDGSTKLLVSNNNLIRLLENNNNKNP